MEGTQDEELVDFVVHNYWNSVTAAGCPTSSWAVEAGRRAIEMAKSSDGWKAAKNSFLDSTLGEYCIRPCTCSSTV